MTVPQHQWQQWRKATASEGSDNCVEVKAVDDGVGVRDSKDTGAGHLSVSPAAFRALVLRAQQSE